MAEDWIKMRKKLAKDGRVLSVSRSCRATRATVIGALVILWSLADDYATDDGALPGYTTDDLDAETSLPGLCDALPSDWFEVRDGVIYLPNYLQHNGDTAKKRAQNTARQKRGRVSRDCRADGATKARPEEKREEEKREEEPPRGRACDLSTPVPAPAPVHQAEQVAVIETLPFVEFEGSPEDLAQRFAFAYRGTYRAHKAPEDTRDGFAELLRLGISPSAIIAAIADKSRDRTEFFNDLKRRLIPPARASPQPTYDGLKRFLARGSGEGLRDTS